MTRRHTGATAPRINSDRLTLSTMNKDQMKGLAQYVAGKVQEHAGNLIGSPEHIVKGLTRQVAGKAQKGRGDVKQTIKDFNRNRPQ